MMLAAVDFDALGQVILASLVAGVAIPVLYSVAIFGLGKAGEVRRAGASGGAAYSALAVAALVLFAAAVVFGVTIMLNKD